VRPGPRFAHPIDSFCITRQQNDAFLIWLNECVECHVHVTLHVFAFVQAARPADHDVRLSLHFECGRGCRRARDSRDFLASLLLSNDPVFCHGAALYRECFKIRSALRTREFPTRERDARASQHPQNDQHSTEDELGRAREREKCQREDGPVRSSEFGALVAGERVPRERDHRREEGGSRDPGVARDGSQHRQGMRDSRC